MTDAPRPNVHRRAITLALLGVTLALGVASRTLPIGWMIWDKSLGDALYAVAVYLALALALPRLPRGPLAAVAFALCLAIELFQLTDIPLALAKDHRWVGWLLGTTFAWHDIVCYAVGVAVISAVSISLASRAGRTARTAEYRETR